MPKSFPLKREEEEALRHEMRIMELLANSPSYPGSMAKRLYENSFFVVMGKSPEPLHFRFAFGKKEIGLEEFLQFALAATTAVENIHRFDVIHKDINDHNVHYNEEKKQCTLVDFDLSITINHQKIIPVDPNFLEGTLSLYLAGAIWPHEPRHRLQNGLLFARVLFYRALTGELPFFSRDPLELVHMHLAMQPRPPNRIELDIPEAVSI